MARLKEIFAKEIKPSLKQHFGYKNHYMVPEIQKIVLNMGMGIDGNDAKILKSSQEDLAAITKRFASYRRFGWRDKKCE